MGSLLRNPSLRLKATLFISTMLLLVGAVLSWYFLSRGEDILRDELQKRVMTLARNLAFNSRYGLLTEDPVILGRLIDGILQEESVVYVAISTGSGILADEFKQDLPGARQRGAERARERAGAVGLVDQATIYYYAVGDQQIVRDAGVYHVVSPVLPSTEPESDQESELADALSLLGEMGDLGGLAAEPDTGPLGAVHVILSVAEMESNIETVFVSGVELTLAIVVLAILASFLFVTYSMGPVQGIAEAASRVADGDLSQAVPSRSNDEIGVLATAFNGMTEALRGITGQIQNTVSQISSSSNSITHSGRELETTVNEQAASTRQVVATANEISATSRDLVRTMANVASMADDTVNAADEGRQGLARMESSMQQMEEGTSFVSEKFALINEKADNINSVVVAITKIADQTNILSLNASIEAEKAGEYGMGFAVVAREIRRLADQTAVATLDIEQTVKQMLGAVSEGGTSMDRFSEEIRTGSEVVRNVATQVGGIIEQVATLKPQFESVEQGMQAQSVGAQQISEAMAQINDAAQQTADSIRETNTALANLTKVADDLAQETSRFKVR